MGDESKYLNTTGDKTTVNSVIPNLEDATTVARVSTENSVKKYIEDIGQLVSNKSTTLEEKRATIIKEMEDANANINELYKQFLAVEELLSSSKGRYGAPEDGKLYDPALVAKETNLEEVQKNVKGARFVLNATLQNKLANQENFNTVNLSNDELDAIEAGLGYIGKDEKLDADGNIVMEEKYGTFYTATAEEELSAKSVAELQNKFESSEVILQQMKARQEAAIKQSDAISVTSSSREMISALSALRAVEMTDEVRAAIAKIENAANNKVRSLEINLNTYIGDYQEMLKLFSAGVLTVDTVNVIAGKVIAKNNRQLIQVFPVVNDNIENWKRDNKIITSDFNQ